jgi:hypothetical protein
LKVFDIELAHFCNFIYVHKTFDGKPERNRLLGRSRRRWEDNIKMNVKGMWCEVVD